MREETKVTSCDAAYVEVFVFQSIALEQDRHGKWCCYQCQPRTNINILLNATPSGMCSIYVAKHLHYNSQYTHRSHEIAIFHPRPTRWASGARERFCLLVASNKMVISFDLLVRLQISCLNATPYKSNNGILFVAQHMRWKESFNGKKTRRQLEKIHRQIQRLNKHYGQE